VPPLHHRRHRLAAVADTFPTIADKNVQSFVGLCRLISLNMIDASHMAPLFRLYFKSEQYSDAIRLTLGKLREQDASICTNCVLLGLQEVRCQDAAGLLEQVAWPVGLQLAHTHGYFAVCSGTRIFRPTTLRRVA